MTAGSYWEEARALWQWSTLKSVAIWYMGAVALGMLTGVGAWAIKPSPEKHAYWTNLHIAAAVRSGATSDQIQLYRTYRSLAKEDRRAVRSKIADISLALRQLPPRDLVYRFYAELRNSDQSTSVAVDMWDAGWRLANPNRYERVDQPQPGAFLAYRGTRKEVDPTEFQIQDGSAFPVEGEGR